jgi:hypothetical protein
MLKAHGSTTKMEEISFSEALVTAYMTIRRHNRDDYIQNISFNEVRNLLSTDLFFQHCGF